MYKDRQSWVGHENLRIVMRGNLTYIYYVLYDLRARGMQAQPSESKTIRIWCLLSIFQ